MIVAPWLMTLAEFSGTLVGFDDYVSKCGHVSSFELSSREFLSADHCYIDMVLEDVTEL